MATTKPLNGRSKDRYFRNLFAAEPELPPAAADRLTEVCAQEITQVRIRLPVSKQTADAPEAAEHLDTAVEPEISSADAAQQPHSDPLEPNPESAETREQVSEGAAPPPPPSFDPYAFSLLALLKRNGRDALLARLGEIGSRDDLRKLAEAQHIALPPDIEGLPAIRDAIADGTERRLADRRAAAS